MTPCVICAGFAAKGHGAVTMFVDAAGVTHAIPDAWLTRRTQSHEAAGRSPVEADARAGRDWSVGCAIEWAMTVRGAA